MTSQSPRPAHYALLLLLLVPAQRAGATEDEPTTEPSDEVAQDRTPHKGALSFFHDNDWFVSADQNYTSGLGFSWASDDVALYGEKNFIRQIGQAFSFLPKVGHDDYRTFVSFNLSQEMYTPQDIASPEPPPDQHPYAGVLSLDTTIYAKARRSMHAYTVRVGCVGPCSGAGPFQRWFHEGTPAPPPEGWKHQLSNEPILNLGYQYHRRLLRNTRARRPHYDLTLRTGGGFGNYYIGANTGLVARLGFPLPDNYTMTNHRFAGGSWLVGVEPPRRKNGWYGYIFLGLDGFAVGRFLPTDGNTFKDGPSGEREDLFANLTSGAVLGYRQFLASWTLTNLSGLNEGRSAGSNDYGTFAVSWFFRPRNK